MKKFLIGFVAALALAVLFGCSIDDGYSSYDDEVIFEGYADFLPSDTLKRTGVKLCVRSAPSYEIGSYYNGSQCGDEVKVQKDGSFIVRGYGFNYEDYSYDARYGEVIASDGPSAVVDLRIKKHAHLNYLTDLARNVVWSYLKTGLSFAEAEKKANGLVLELLGLPSVLDDFSSYTMFGDGEGDLMSLAVYALVTRFEKEKYRYYNNLNIDYANRKWKDSDAESAIKRVLMSFLYDVPDLIPSIRRNLQKFGNVENVGYFEKYLSKMYEKYLDVPSCGSLNDGELYDISKKQIVCKDEAWRLARVDDYESGYFNKDVAYGTLKDSRDGNVYKTVVIDSLEWTAENLRYADSSASENLKGQVFCFKDVKEKCDEYGMLYSWSAAMDIPADTSAHFSTEYGEKYQGICPDGWRLPSYEDYRTLHAHKADDVITQVATGLTNSTGFSMVLGGFKYSRTSYTDSTVYYGYEGEESGFWLSENSMKYSNAVIFEHGYNTQFTYDDYMFLDAFYIRCVRNAQKD